MQSEQVGNCFHTEPCQEVKSIRRIRFFEKLIVGGLSGVIATSIVYPMDLVKTCLQKQPSAGSSIKTFQTIIRRNGILGLYRGLGVNLLGIFPVQALKLAGNDLFRDLLADKHGNVSFISSILAGAGAGTIQVIASNPMEIMKIRLQTQTSTSQPKNLAGIFHELGIRGLYKGSSVTLLRDIPYFMIFFPLNHALVDFMTPPQGQCKLGGLLLAGCGAGMTSAFVSSILLRESSLVTPMDVIKTRVQIAKGSVMETSFAAMFSNVLKTEGVFALFKGASMRMCVQAPMFAIMTTCFEMQKRWIAS